MKKAKRQFFGLSVTQWLALGFSAILAFGAWRAWVRPVVTFFYFQVSSVSTARSGLGSKDELVRLAAVRSLGSGGPAANVAIPDLIIALNDSSPNVASDAACTLGSILSSQSGQISRQDEVVNALIKALGHENGEVRRYAAYALSQNADDARAAIPRLTELLHDDHMASMAARALGSIGPAARGAIPTIAELLISSNPGERAEALSKLKPLSKDVVSAIKALVEDEVDFVRNAARNALQEIVGSGGQR